MEPEQEICGLIRKQELELQGLTRRRLLQLQEQLQAKDLTIHELESQLQRLREDCSHNYKLVQERDQEIADLEIAVAKARASTPEDAQLSVKLVEKERELNQAYRAIEALKENVAQHSEIQSELEAAQGRVQSLTLELQFAQAQSSDQSSVAEHRLQYTLKENQRLKEELRTTQETTQHSQALVTQLKLEHQQELETLQKQQREADTSLRDTCSKQLQTLQTQVDSLLRDKRELKDQLSLTSKQVRCYEEQTADLQRQLDSTHSVHQYSLQLKEAELAAVREQSMHWQVAAQYKELSKFSTEEPRWQQTATSDPYTELVAEVERLKDLLYTKDRELQRMQNVLESVKSERDDMYRERAKYKEANTRLLAHHQEPPETQCKFRTLETQIAALQQGLERRSHTPMARQPVLQTYGSSVPRYNRIAAVKSKFAQDFLYTHRLS